LKRCWPNGKQAPFFYCRDQGKKQINLFIEENGIVPYRVQDERITRQGRLIALLRAENLNFTTDQEAWPALSIDQGFRTVIGTLLANSMRVWLMMDCESIK
jgi:hypothetical protein